MLLSNENAATIAAYFKNKFQVVSYVGCWSSKSITFALYQDNTKCAGIELTIKRPEGDLLEKVEVVKVKRLSSYSYDERQQRYTRKYLPIYKG
jgi:hypothetical protein